MLHAHEFAHSNCNHASAESAETKSNALCKLSTKHKVHQNSNAASRAAGTEECYSRQGDQSVSLSHTPASAESSKAAFVRLPCTLFCLLFCKILRKVEPLHFAFKVGDPYIPLSFCADSYILDENTGESHARFAQTKHEILMFSRVFSKNSIVNGQESFDKSQELLTTRCHLKEVVMFSACNAKQGLWSDTKTLTATKRRATTTRNLEEKIFGSRAAIRHRSFS